MKKIVLLVYIMCLTTVCAFAQLPTIAEYNALIDFYNATGGPNWTHKIGWSTANPNQVESVSGWNGIEVDENGHVVSIFLFANNLSGRLPSSIGNLSYLKTLWITNSNLTGSIPPEIGNLSQLESLELPGNALTGRIPPEIGELENLKILYLQVNSLSGPIPSSLSNLSHLEELWIEENQFSGDIPAELGELTSLWFVSLGRNNLTGVIPPELSTLTGLKYLDLSRNKLTGEIPVWLGTFTELKDLYLNNNQLEGDIPNEFSNLTKLRRLDLNDNNLAGNVPATLSSISSLLRVYLQGNKFTFLDLLAFKQSYAGTTLVYSPQQSIDDEKLTHAEFGAAFTFSAGIDRQTTTPSVYQWFRVDNGVTTSLSTASSSSHTFSISALDGDDFSADFYYKITNPAAPALTLTSQIQRILRPVSSDVNYVRTIDVTAENKKTVEQVTTAPISQRMISYTYIDGLGRPIQKVSQQASPSHQDLVQPILYDEFGREKRKYLPFATDNNGDFNRTNEIVNPAGDYIGVAQTFYNGGVNGTVADDDRPFSETMFELSPLDRPTKEYGPGKEWSPITNGGVDKPITYSYLSNVHALTGTATQEAIFAFKVTEGGDLELKSPIQNYIEPGGYFSSNQLLIKSAKDENGNVVREYTNKAGQLILKKVQATTSANDLNNLDAWACTYYVYDDVGNLSFVLPPEGFKNLKSFLTQH